MTLTSFRRFMAKAAILLQMAVVVLFVSCGGEVSPQELAAVSAKGYYEHLISGEYEAYLSGVNMADSLPGGYREQLLTNARQFMARQKEEHGGITGVSVVGASTDSVAGHTNVFLLLSFADSLREEVVVPMLEVRPSEWRMK